jgi:hypothetical protein
MLISPIVAGFSAIIAHIPQQPPSLAMEGLSKGIMLLQPAAAKIPPRTVVPAK